MTAPTAVERPDHIPSALVHAFDYMTAPIGMDDPAGHWAKTLAASAPPIFWTPLNGGHWVVRDPALALEILRTTDVFSSVPDYNEARRWSPLLLPTQSDPPDHLEYRKVFGAYFSPVNMRKLEPSIRTFTRDLLSGLRPGGRCEFVSEIGEVLPITIFLRMAEAPLSDAARLIGYTRQFTRSSDRAVRADGVAKLSEYILHLFDARRGNPGDDILSLFLKSDKGGRPLTRDEELGLGTLLFLAGLDTVKSTMSFAMLRLAQSPALYADLVADSELIPGAVEELLRFSGPVVAERGLAKDVDFHGVPFRRNDRLLLPLMLLSFDSDQNPDPFQLDLHRDLPQHMNFGAGPHRCAGSHLARIELRVLLEEWTALFPEFGLNPDEPPQMEGGSVWTPSVLPLTWPVQG